MSCAWKEEQAYRFTDGSMEHEAARAFTTHMEECSECRKRTDEAESVERLLRGAMIPVLPPPTLASRIARAVEVETSAGRKSWWFGLAGMGRSGGALGQGRSLSPVLAGLLAVLLLGVVATLAAPGAVMAVVQRALLFVPGLGISAVDEGHLVATEPVSVEVSGVRFTLEALLSDGESTTVKFNVTGLPGGKEGWQKAERVGDDPPPAGADQRRSGPPRMPYLQDGAGNRYDVQWSQHGVGGSPRENRIEGQMSFPALPAGLRSIELVVPVDHLVPPGVVAGADEQEWVLSVPLSPAAESGLPRAVPQGAPATDNGVTLRVAASTLERDRTVVLLQGEATGAEQVLWVGRNGGDLPDEVILTDDRGRRYELKMPASRGRIGDAQYSEDLYFAPVVPGAQQLTLAVRSVQLRGSATATITVDLSGREQGESFDLNREVELGEYTVLLKSATVRGSWLDIEVDLGPEVNGRMLSSFGLTGSGSWSSSNGAKDGQQMDQFGVEIEPGQETVELQLGFPLVNLEGSWEMTFPVASSS